MAHEEIDYYAQAMPADKSKIRKIWITALVLAVVTGIEYVFAFTWPKEVWGLALIFIVLTLVKAFFIVGEFMHLKHEVKALIWSVLLPIIFLCWLILAMYIEGDEIFNALNNVWERWL